MTENAIKDTQFIDLRATYKCNRADPKITLNITHLPQPVFRAWAAYDEPVNSTDKVKLGLSGFSCPLLG